MADTKTTVMEFYDLAFQQKNPAEARKKYMSDGYIQHNPMVPDGADTFVAAIGGMYEQFPDFTSKVHRVIAEGELVVIHHEVHFTPGDQGNSVIDIFRVEDGKVIEHWDIIQEIAANPANDNTMF
jgi:predicted SnoaL-like aldol condensation-catalyzing enzyme